MTAYPVQIDAHPESRVHNSQAHGIGRVVALDGLVAWNNLGRNVVFAGQDFVPRAVFDESVFDDDEPSQFDLDVHAILEPTGSGVIVVLNHYGTVRAFDSAEVRGSASSRSLVPVWTRAFVGDVERVVVVGDRLVGSAPREVRQPGLLVSEPLRAGNHELDVVSELAEFGIVTALAATGDEAVVVGGGRRVSLAALGEGRARARWKAAVDFEPAFLVAEDGLIWAAGSDAGAVDDYDWEAQHGGGFVALDAGDGSVVVEGRFAHDLAWGNGGVALAVVSGLLCGAGRLGELYLHRARDGSLAATTPPIADHSLGIAHCAASGGELVVGFNRGGYRLFGFPADLLRAHVH